MAECMFAREIFQPFHREDQDTFRYGPWLHYFITSLAWRSVILDLPYRRKESGIPERVLEDLERAELTMRNYLFGATGLAGAIRNHAIAKVRITECCPEIADTKPNVRLRRSAWERVLVSKASGSMAAYHNLAGFICVSIIKGNPQDLWNNTRVSASGGAIVQPQQVRSWVMNDLFETFMELDASYREMSPHQKAKVEQAVQSAKIDRAVVANPDAGAWRFQKWDYQLKQQSTRE